MRPRGPEPVVVHETQCNVEGRADGAPGSVRWRTLLSADRTATEALTIGIAEIEPGRGEPGRGEPGRGEPFRAHCHAQPEVYYVLAGEGVVEIDGVAHAVRPGSAVFIPGDAAHGARNTGADVLRILYVFPADSFAEIQYRLPSA